MTICESARNIEVMESVDVLVCGGGIAGVSAAVSSARAGAVTMLVERNGCLGGILTSNIIPNLCNAHFTEDVRQKISGIPLEIMHRLQMIDGCSPNWELPNIKLVFDEQKMKVVLIEMLLETGVKVLTHVVCTAPIMNNSNVKGVFVETKIGRKAILAKVVVDCTGEADILSKTGCPMRVMSGTCSLAFKMGNVDGQAFYQYFNEHQEEFPKNHDGIRDFGDFSDNWNKCGYFYFPHRGGRKLQFVQDSIKKGEYQKSKGKFFGLDMMCLIGMRTLGDISVNSMLWRLNSLDPIEISEAELEAQIEVYEIADYLIGHMPGFSKAHVSQISQDIGIRVSRAIEGEKTLTIQDLTSLQSVYSGDVIGIRNTQPWNDDGKSDHPFDADDKGIVRKESISGETTKDGRHFFYDATIDLPYGIIVPKKVENILAGSGKTLSTIPQTNLRCGTNGMRTAQAAGIAAAVVALEGSSTHSVDIRKVQMMLLAQDVDLGTEERLRSLGLR